MKTIETSGKTVEEAIEIALLDLDADRTDVEIEVISKGKPGILGIGSEPAKIRAELLENIPDTVKIAGNVLKNIVAFSGVEVVVTLKQVYQDDVEGPVFDLDGEDSGLLIGRKGETLRALQLLVNLLTSAESEERSNVLVDVAGYQERRHLTLRTIAKKTADRVISTGKPVSLEPMPASERRIVHIALSEHLEVKTISTGSGLQRKVMIEPVDK